MYRYSGKMKIIGNYKIRKGTPGDHLALLTLYKAVAQAPNGLARRTDEITVSYIDSILHKSRQQGIVLVAYHVDTPGIPAGEIHAYSSKLQNFSHVLSNLTVVVHPKHQNKGVGQQLFTELLARVQRDFPDILRVELMAKENNEQAIQVYKKLGFVIEGRYPKRVWDAQTKQYETDLAMTWYNTLVEPEL